MAQGRSSAMGLVALVLVVFGLLELSTATTYTVGDNGGWTFGVSDWPKGKKFVAGDVLVMTSSSIREVRELSEVMGKTGLEGPDASSASHIGGLCGVDELEDEGVCISSS
ncbi:chemocyanin [Amborella trichopoda]|uniref:chemocyanin n=1 Tax=Amborella trichopoda TaxID=13333 RepID=UPI0005D3C3E3|nr:chemocyanin [Amborella trichopoda]|eukprot:XP_011622767.1 chemocyanin [Amborella trichopoda]